MLYLRRMRFSVYSLKRFKQLTIFIVAIVLGIVMLRNALHVESKGTRLSPGWNLGQEDSMLYPPFFSIGQEDLAKVASYFFPPQAVIYTKGIVYDMYSIRELGQLQPGLQWLTFPLPNERITVTPWVPQAQSSKAFPFPQSPATKSTLAYVEKVYVITDPKLNDRSDNIIRMFIRHHIPVESIEWRMGKWNRATCAAKENKNEIYRTLNLLDKPFGREERYCALTIKHVEIWKEIAASNSSLSLILEDDATFVPFFKEKFDRFVYTAIRTGALRISLMRCAKPRTNLSRNEWIEQDPAFMIGTCQHKRDFSFQAHLFNASPILSTHKDQFSRCTHAYLLTSCSARELIRQLEAQKYAFLTPDHLQIYLGRRSPTLQPFWLDPPIVYQGSQVIDLDGIKSFRKSTP